MVVNGKNTPKSQLYGDWFTSKIGFTLCKVVSILSYGDFFGAAGHVSIYMKR